MAFSKAFSHLDGEIIPHVPPQFEAKQNRRSATPACRRVEVIVPPDGVQHTDQPEASEE